MTDYIQNDIPWDDEEQLVDREPAGSDGRTHFGHLRLYGLQLTKVFEAGSYVTIPGVKGGDFNEQDANGDMLFKGWKPGGNRWLFVLVATKKNQEGNSYQVVKQYKGKSDRADEGHDWGDFVFPAIKTLSNAQRGKLSSEGLYCKWDEVPTGRKFTPEGETEEKDIPVWTNFQPFTSKEEMEKAESEFFAQFSNGNAPNSDNDHYPASWASDIPGMLAYAQEEKAKGSNPADIAKTVMLIGKDGTPTEAINGEKVDVVKVLAEILEVPEAMVKL